MNIGRQVRKFNTAIQMYRNSGEHEKADYMEHLRELMLSEADKDRPRPFSHYYPQFQEEFGE
jgi:hypothetical protein